MHRMHTWLSMLCPTRAPDICLAYDTFAHSLALPLLSLLHAFAHRSSRSSGLSSGAVPTPRSLSIRPTSRTTHTCSVRLLLHRPPHPHVTSHSRDPTTSRHKHSHSRCGERLVPTPPPSLPHFVRSLCRTLPPRPPASSDAASLADFNPLFVTPTL